MTYVLNMIHICPNKTLKKKKKKIMELEFHVNFSK